MAKNKPDRTPQKSYLLPQVKKAIWGFISLGVAILLLLAQFGSAGPAGALIFKALSIIFGWGYLLLPLGLIALSAALLSQRGGLLVGATALSTITFIISSLGLVEIMAPGKGGWIGNILGALKIPFGVQAAFVINLVVLIISIIAIANIPVSFNWSALWKKEREDEDLEIIIPDGMEEEVEKSEEEISSAKEGTGEPAKEKIELVEKSYSHVPLKSLKPKKFTNYSPPPLDLLKSTSEKPTTGDLRANANIIKRTLESFGIPVEMGEVNIGPKVTRYTLKPAEGIKLSRITALNQDLALALASHPIRIEAPIPGKSLVGIEIPNKTAALVRLGSLLGYPDFQAAKPLLFALGRDVSGEPIFGNIETMPHLLVAGATGSGKSVTIHSMIVSLLYKNSPQDLKLVLIDPKRVELSIYEGLPHLVGPVITESKRSLSVFRWAISEMESRYEQLLKASSRDIKSFNSKVKEEDRLPYVVIVVDELADLMQTYGREVEGYIIRLAQMARATGIHLVLSTQRPSVEVITGLIKANITSRIALQVASQIDSRTILDSAGAEKLLGGGDLLFISSEFSKPKRIQGTYITEEEINTVAGYIRDHNQELSDDSEKIDFGASGNNNNITGNAAGNEKDVFSDFGESDTDDDLYDEAVAIIRDAKKASASFLQRRLKVGYARAARLLDLMEMNGIIGPGDGAKPREVYLDQLPPED
ncbi:MAG: DNA translocase FtsK [Anaplasmataceae bacterium]|nr:DNA translocase FtsK [Anaplasmataceae bacterium]